MTHMERALSLARKAVGSASPNPAVGAVVVRDGAVVGEGWTQPAGQAHAEVMAIRRAGAALGTHDLSGCTMYVNGASCPMCSAAMLWAKIDKVYYAAAIEDCLLTGSDFAPLRHDVGKPINERSTPCEHLLAKEGRDLIAEWAGILENDPVMRKLLGPSAGK